MVNPSITNNGTLFIQENISIEPKKIDYPTKGQNKKNLHFLIFDMKLYN